METTSASILLSRQETRVIELSMEGRGDKGIAQAMGLSLGTVRTYWKRIAAKIGGSTRAEIVTNFARRSADASLQRERALVVRLEAEIEQRRSAEARFRAICACSPIGIYLSDVDGRCLYVNPAWERITGLPFEATQGDSWRRIVHPDDLERLEAWGAESSLKGSSGPIEFRFVGEGGPVWVRANFSPMVVDERVVGSVGTIENVGDYPSFRRFEVDRCASGAGI